MGRQYLAVLVLILTILAGWAGGTALAEKGGKAGRTWEHFQEEVRARQDRGYDVARAITLAGEARAAHARGEARAAQELMERAFAELEAAPRVAGGSAQPVKAAAPAAGGEAPGPILTESPFGVHVSNFRVQEPNELGADNRLIIRASGLGDKLRFQDLDGIVAASQTRLVVTLVADGQRSEESHSYCLLAGDELARWQAMVGRLVERYDGDADWGCTVAGGRDCYEPGDGLAPDSALAAAIRQRPIRSWQIENEWPHQLKDCSGGKEEHITARRYVEHLAAMGSLIRGRDSSARIILGALTGVRYVAALAGFAPRPYVETGYTDCQYQRVPIEELRKPGRELERIRQLGATIEEVLVQGAAHYDIIDIHFYENDPQSLVGQVQWLTDLLRRRGVGPKAVWSLENAGPYYFFVETGDRQPADCKKAGRDDLPYSDEILAGQIIKHYVVGISAGVEKIFWSSIFPTLSWSDNFIRTALVDVGKAKKPAYATYRLMTEKLAGVRQITRKAPGIFQVVFRDRPALLVAWAEDEGGSRDLGAYLDAGKVRITWPVTRRGQEKAESEVRPVTAVPLGRLPVFVEAAP
ncbi:MAG: hypothetical protein AB1634_13660 [Thermodesulfobacteriota bacterium]